ncbi:MAG: antibiotic biosynthesis monooxygenase [Ktedonobacteraceae bacterium]|nr:antibiotic biosynthesis monooxygenase [Ktedonobacteraceae bacterium]
MELLVVTLTYTTAGRDADILARIRLIHDTVHNAQGLVTSHFYRSRNTSSCYLMLTTWESEESWWRSQARYNPKQILLNSSTELLTAPPEQWCMRYLWGYSRPAASPVLAAAQLATIRTEQLEVAQRAWIEALSRQSVQPTLAFAFLARGTHESALASQNPREPCEEGFYHRGPTFLNLLSWPNESEREEFYADAHYQALHRFTATVGTMQIVHLEPM